MTVLDARTYAYDDLGRLLGAEDDDSALAFAYDALGRLTVADAASVGSPDVVLTSQYDNLGRRTQLSAVDEEDDFTNEYAYDALGRATRIVQQGSPGGNDVHEKRVDLAYDHLGRYTSVTRYQDLAGTQLVAASDYEYDDAGRLTSLVHKGSDGIDPLTPARTLSRRLGRLTVSVAVECAKA